MPMTDPGAYPFPDKAVKIAAQLRERIVCGGFTSLEWNQHDTTDVAFTCSHGAVNGCDWRIVVGSTTSLHVLLIFEIDLADELHREHAWSRLEERSGPTPT